MNECKECYSNKKRITPLLKPRECLENHLQYICSTCKTLDIAKLYLRTADVTMKTNCGIYEIVSANGRKSYKIFSNEAELQEYLKKNKSKTCVAMTPIYQRSKYIEFNNSEIRRLNREEVEKYIREQKEEK